MTLMFTINEYTEAVRAARDAIIQQCSPTGSSPARTSSTPSATWLVTEADVLEIDLAGKVLTKTDAKPYAERVIHAAS